MTIPAVPPYGHELAALVTIETAERLAMKAATAVRGGDTGLALRLLAALIEETTARTATRVKDQGISDGIAQRARVSVGITLALIESDQRLAAEPGRTHSR
jgi:hypothetical protein